MKTNTGEYLAVAEYDDIDHAEMVTRLAKDGSHILAEATKEKMHLWHMATGLMGEAVEFMTATDYGNAIEELGDAAFYTEALTQIAFPQSKYPGINFSELDGNHTVIHLLARRGAASALTICAGEVLDLAKKHVVYGKELPPFALQDAVRNAATCIMRAVENYDLGVADIRDANMQKLWKRYPGFVYTNQAAIARADKVEGAE